jgi:hypothetical protein
MISQLTLPSELDVLAIPPVAILSVLQVALAMTVAAVHCEHPDLDEITGYLADGLQPPRSLHLAQTICDRADELNRIIDAYRVSLDVEISRTTATTDLPF